MDAFLELFGNVTLDTVIMFILAAFFLYGCYIKVQDHFHKQYEAQEERDEMLKKALSEVNKYPVYRQQSIEIQKELTTAIKRIEDKQDKYAARLEEIEQMNKTRKLNEICEKLIHSYHYYTSRERNPLASWSQMESDAFWASFRDYENLGGDNHMHTVVEPAMKELQVIDMSDAEHISELYASRK